MGSSKENAFTTILAFCPFFSMITANLVEEGFCG